LATDKADNSSRRTYSQTEKRRAADVQSGWRALLFSVMVYRNDMHTENPDFFRVRGKGLEILCCLGQREAQNPTARVEESWKL
jgi:hypothetical protein